MKTKRNLSGIYFRSRNEKTKIFGTFVFEDLSEQEQDKVMSGHDIEWVKSLAKKLANTLNQISEEFDIFAD